MEQLVLLLIIGAISLINWLIEQSGKRREQRRFEAERARREAETNPYLEPASPPAPEPVPELHEPAPAHDMRRLLEAFGIPVPEEPAPRGLPLENPEPQLQPVLSAPPSPEPRTIPAKAKPTPSPAKKSPLEIKSPAALRQAILWREILGPPRSLQSF